MRLQKLKLDPLSKLEQSLVKLLRPIRLNPTCHSYHPGTIVTAIALCSLSSLRLAYYPIALVTQTHIIDNTALSPILF